MTLVFIKLNRLRREVEAAAARLHDAILEEMDRVARRNKLTEMTFFQFTTLRRDGNEVEDEEIRKLEDFYSDHVHANGFFAKWTPEKGWE